MGNQIRGSQREDAPPTWVPWVKLSNGATSVAMALWAMAATALASTASQRRLASAITTRDQAILGRGAVGFSLGQFPWNYSSFDDDRQFLVAACERAAGGDDWQRLSFTPTENATSTFARIAIMLRELNAADVGDTPQSMHRLMMAEPAALCDTHQVFLHREGCLVCHCEHDG